MIPLGEAVTIIDAGGRNRLYQLSSSIAWITSMPIKSVRKTALEQAKRREDYQELVSEIVGSLPVLDPSVPSFWYFFFTFSGRVVELRGSALGILCMRTTRS